MPDRPRLAGAHRLTLSVVALSTVLAACGGTVASPSAPATPSSSPSPVPSAAITPSPVPAETAPTQPGSQEVTPSSPPMEVGAVEAITVFTHCGFEGRVDWAGSFWRETGREPEGGAIGDPEDAGRITLINATTARFESSTGTVVILERVAGPVTLQPCD